MSCKQKIYITLIISAIIIIALISILVFPLAKEIKSLSANLIEKKNLMSSYEKRIGDYLKNLKNKYAELEPQISKINKSFVDSGRVIDFILAVEKAAALTNNYLEIKEISSSAEEKTLSFQISLWGSFSNLIKFLVHLENMDYFVDAGSLQITKIEEKSLKNLTDKGIMVSAEDIKSIISIKTYTNNK